MNYNIIISESPIKDLDENIKYIIEILLNNKAASDFIDEVERKYIEVSKHPYMFELSRDDRLRKKGYHRIVVNNYIILYLINDKSKEVIISRIFYGGQNYKNYL